MKFIFLFVLLVTICFCVNAQVKNQTTYSEKIIGTWIGVADKSSQIIFTKNEQLNYYMNRLMASFTYLIQKDTLIAVDKEDGDKYRYLITSLNKDALTLKFIRTGTVIEYRRKRN